MIVIIDYGVGNLGSHINIIKRHGYKDPVISSDPAVVADASKLILSGVGSFDKGMSNIEERGLLEVLNRKVLEEKTPFLGICLGMQLLSEGSEEGQKKGLGWIPGRVKKFVQANGKYKVPHMGWNRVALKNDSPLFESLSEEEARFYFVHSYYLECSNEEDVVAQTWYINDFVSAVQRGNVYGTQFHPEKSHLFGLQLYKNFLSV